MELHDETWEDKVKLPESLFINRKQRTVKILTERLRIVELRLKKRMLIGEDTALFFRKKTFPHGNIKKVNPSKKKACFCCTDEGHFILERPKLKNMEPKHQHNDEYDFFCMCIRHWRKTHK
ncbi:hypothetical protein PR048_002967 [Dryococelus australis]|uniref:Uncharacterized protein n=1 Tax=Dryococelus australis TaxID=614101 RepID=A0ABQ9ILN8_9NEOP|nr:hypothetical protein PR048_002967 [Dryococelus australis]